MNGTHMSTAGMAGMMGSQTGATTTAADQLTIVHVQKGCHVWSDAGKQMAAMHLRMHTGQMLRILNQDVDMHRMMELSGPTMMALGGPMAQGKTDTVTFTKPGTYVFGTKVSSMKGMPEVETIGPDNNLKLTVTVVYRDLLPGGHTPPLGQGAASLSSRLTRGVCRRSVVLRRQMRTIPDDTHTPPAYCPYGRRIR